MYLKANELSPEQHQFLRLLLASPHWITTSSVAQSGVSAGRSLFLFVAGTLLVTLLVGMLLWTTRFGRSTGMEAAREEVSEVAAATVLASTHEPVSTQATTPLGLTATVQFSATLTPQPNTTSEQTSLAPATATPSGTVSLTPVRIHQVAKGENLYRIALRYGITVDALMARNGITDPTQLEVGQILIIP